MPNNMKHALGTENFQKEDLPHLKEAQVQTLIHLAKKESVLAILPTGYGKSICFQVPVLFWNWKIILVAPILSLIDDHFIHLQKMGLDPISLSGTYKMQKVEEKIKKGKWKILITTPEKLVLLHKKKFWQKIFLSCSCIVMDEVHCSQSWRFFRKSYQKMDILLQNWHHAPILALTATLSAVNTEKITTRWQKKMKDVRIPLGRPNLCLDVWPLETQKERYLALTAILRNLPKDKTALVYCGSRARTEKIANFLSSCAWNACAFHAGQTTQYRTTTLKAFQKKRISILCATSAFGMGVNCSHVGIVVHWGPPSSLTNYWQEVGRAGRGSFAAQSVLLWSRGDIIQMRFFMKKNKSNPINDRKEEGRAMWEFLFSKECRQVFLAKYFSLPQESCGICDNCRSKKENFSFKKIYFPWKNPWWLKISTEKKEIREKFFYAPCES